MQADDLSTIEDDTRGIDGSTTEATSVNGGLLADDLVRRCHELLNELEAFGNYLKECKQEHAVELKPFRNSIAAELKSLERVSCVC